MNRIGPQMKRAVLIVAANPLCCIYFVAKALHIGARTGRNNALGYDPVHRAIDAGLICATKAQGGNRWSLFVTTKGFEVVK